MALSTRLPSRDLLAELRPCGEALGRHIEGSSVKQIVESEGATDLAERGLHVALQAPVLHEDAVCELPVTLLRPAQVVLELPLWQWPARDTIAFISVMFKLATAQRGTEF